MDIKTIKAEMIAKNPNLSFQVKDNIAYQVGRQIEKIRVSRGTTQAELATALKTKQSAISRLERGASLPSLSTLKRIANFFGSYVDVKIPEHPEMPAEGSLYNQDKIIRTETGKNDESFRKLPYYSMLSLTTGGNSHGLPQEVI